MRTRWSEVSRRVRFAAMALVFAAPLAAQEPVAPSISCAGATQTSIQIQVCGNGASQGWPYIIEWATKEDYDVYGWNTPDPPCSQTFSDAQYLVAGSDCVTVTPDSCKSPIRCDEAYVFRIRYEGTGKEWGDTIVCTTDPCDGGGGGCTYTWGYWKTHGPVPTGNNENEWPQDVLSNGLTLGTVNYTAAQLLSILNTPPAGNGLISLAHQLIAALLNIENGADGSSIQSSIDAANTLIGGLMIPPVGTGSLKPSQTSALVNALTGFNEGLTGPGHCDDGGGEEPPK